MADVTGWGRAGWGTDGWGTPDELDVTGVAGTSALGSVAVDAKAEVSVTSNRGVGSVGSVIVGISVTFEVTGVSATGGDRNNKCMGTDKYVSDQLKLARNSRVRFM